MTLPQTLKAAKLATKRLKHYYQIFRLVPSKAVMSSSCDYVRLVNTKFDNYKISHLPKYINKESHREEYKKHSNLVEEQNRQGHYLVLIQAQRTLSDSNPNWQP